MVSNQTWSKVTKKLKMFTPLSDKELEKFRPLWSTEKRVRKEIITNGGDVEKYIYFVISGTQRIYHIDESGKETTIVLMYEGDFGGVLDSMLLSSPSRFYYEALSASELIKCPVSDLRKLIIEYPALQGVLETGAAFALSGMMERMVELQSLSTEERYRKMMKRSSHVLQLIPHKYIASYLGIDPTNFSKLVNSVRI